MAIPEIPMHLLNFVDRRLHSIEHFTHAGERTTDGYHYYAPNHANPVILHAIHADIKSSCGVVIPKGYYAIVKLTRHAGPKRSAWSIELYNTEKDAYRAFNYKPSL